MKNIKKIITVLVLFQLYVSVNASDLVDAASKGMLETKALFKSIVEEKSDQLQALLKEKAALESQKVIVLKEITSDINENKNKRSVVEKELEKNPDDEFLVKKLSLLTETFDVLRDIQRIWEGLIKKVSDNVSLLEGYQKDPGQKEYIREMKISSGPYFFEDLEDAHQKTASQQRFVEQLRRRKDGILKEQKNLAQAFEKATDEYKEKKNKQDDFSKESSDPKKNQAPFALSTKQQVELLPIQTNLFKLKKDFAELQLKEKTQELALVDNEFFIETIHLDVLIDTQQKIKSSITVTAEQIEPAFNQLEKKKQHFSALKAKYNDEINKIRKTRDEQNAKLNELSALYSIPLGNELNTWSFEPKQTLESYRGLAQVGSLNTYVLLLDEREGYFLTLISLEQEKINYAQEIARVKETYYKIISHKFGSEDDIAKEIRKNAVRQSETIAMLKSYKTKKEEIEAALVSLQDEVLDKLKKRKADVQKQKDTIFKGHIPEYAQSLNFLDKAEEYLVLRVDVIGNTGKSYAEIISILDKISGHTKFIFAQLESITIWYRPEGAISWSGIQAIGTNVKQFFLDLYSHVHQLDKSMLAMRAKELIKSPLQLLIFLLLAALIAGSLFMIHSYAGLICSLFGTISEQMPHLRTMLLSCAMVLAFIAEYSIGLGIWAIAFVFIKQYAIVDPYTLIFFYLISIPYLLYLAHAAIEFMVEYNERNRYFLIGQDSLLRFQIILSILLYTTIFCLLFRRAFMLSQFGKSELPAILLTINLIVLQVSLILLITKDQVLNLVPTYWERLYQFINNYYYFIIVFIMGVIILSNPYIGYGRLVVYLAWGCLFTFILILTLHWVHSLIKRGASLIFFSSSDEIVRERFAYAKTWFGVIIIVSFLMLCGVGVIIGAKIWGWPIGFNDVVKWLNVPIFGIGKGTSNPLTIITILTILLFVLAGFFISFAFNRFVIEKIFDLMLVDAGVQNAITNLTRYLLVIAAILLGFQSVGYGGLITYLYVLILGIGYLVQNPIHDLIAYFIILLQRPIKVGDYIQVSNDVVGVVRNITPKSVTLRKKNSTTIVVPNNQIINNSIINWNYARNFIAFDDIILIIGIKEDPSRVKDMLFSAVDSHPKILKNPKPVIRLDEFRPDGYEFMVRGFLSSAFTLDQWDIASEVRLMIVKILRENNVEMAMPLRIMVNSPRHHGHLEDHTKDRGPKMVQ